MYFLVSYLKGSSYFDFRIRADSLYDVSSKLDYHLDGILFTNLSIVQVSKSTFDKSRINELL